MMDRNVGGAHPLRIYLHEALHESLTERLRLDDVSDVERYLVEMLLRFLSLDALFVRDSMGRRVESIAEMLMEGDVRFNADSFDREREVHRHIGDLLLFSSSLFPEMLTPMRTSVLDPVLQGSQSYRVVSTFEYGRYAEEAPLFRKLSQGFSEFQQGLVLARPSIFHS